MTTKRAICKVANTDLVSYETPRKSNPFETTVYAWDTNEATCERPEHHNGPHGFTHRRTYLQFDNATKASQS